LAPACINAGIDASAGRLRGDRRVFEAFLSGVRPARSTGLTLNKATAMELGARP
jgi:hypothetical protein